MISQTIVITGASDGIGAAAAHQLASAGHDVVLVGRSQAKTEAVAHSIGTDRYFLADFQDLSQVRRLAEDLGELGQIDVLAHNAGGLFSGPDRTADGFEKTFQVNHLAPYLLTHQLLPTLLRSRTAIINTSSIGARLFSKLDLKDLNTWNSYTPNAAYGNAKLANILFARGLHRRFHGRGLTAMAFHPGNVATSFASDTTSYFRWVYHGILKKALISPERGGQSLAHYAVGTPGVTWHSGGFYGPGGRPMRTHKLASDERTIDAHWKLSADMLDVSW